MGADDQPCPSIASYRYRAAVDLDATCSYRLRHGVQPAPSAQRAFVPGSLQIHKQSLAAKGIDLDKLAQHVGALFGLAPERLSVGRYPDVVKARSLLCFWAVRELEITATALARRIGLTQPAVSIAVKRGETIAGEKGYDIMQIVR